MTSGGELGELRRQDLLSRKAAERPVMVHVELIVGPAGSGKTTYIRREFCAELAARQAEGWFGTAVWITPTQRSRRQVLRSLVSADLPACFSPNVVTFDEFAEHLLRTAPEAVRPLSHVAKRKLLRDLINDLNRRRKLTYFGAVAETAGFLELCVSFISELKREEVWPEEFEKACRGGSEQTGRVGGSRKDRELALIYDRYQRCLHAADRGGSGGEIASGLYDGEGRFWTARTLMNRGHRGPYRDLTLAVIDGFSDFTRTQYEMLGTLAKWAPRVLITLPQDAADSRQDLFAKSTVALDELRKTFSRHRVNERRFELVDSLRDTAFGHIAGHLFDNPREAAKRSDAAGVSVLSCARETGEFEIVARRVKRLLVGGTAADDIVVAFRSLDGIADTVREAFAAAGIPATIEVGRLIAQTGAVRLLLALLELEREDWPFTRLSGVLNSTLFRPDWPGIADGAAARRAVSALRALNLDRGREVILTALARRTERQDRRSESDFDLALSTLRQLSDELAPFRRPATFADWVDRLLHIAAELRITLARGEAVPGDDGQLVANELGGWEAFVRLVEEARKVETLAGGPAKSLGLPEFRRQLAELLAGQTWDADEPEDRTVRVLSAEQVRNLDVPHLFLCGLSESTFPRGRGDDCLYGDAERHRLSEHGVPLGHRSRQSREEMLLFYGCVTRARRSLTLSFPTLNEGGEPLYPSPYLAAILELFEPDAVRAESCSGLDPIPGGADECATPADLRVLATSQALDGRPGLFAAMAGRRDWSGAALGVAAGAEMATARFATRGLTAYEGMLNDPRNLKRLRLRFGARHEFSATELETYAAHPFRFFLAYVLGLEPPQDPGPGTDFARRGRTMHAALAALHRRLCEGAADAIPADALGRMLRSEVEALSHAGDSPLQRALRRIERQILGKKADQYGGQWDAYLRSLLPHWDGPPRPAYFEVPFGNVPEDEDGPSGTIHPVVEFGPDGERVRVRGKIDRVDLGTSRGQAVFNVIDYKLTASPRRFIAADVEFGRSLQLAVYAAAARRLGLVEGDLFQLAFWSLNGDGFVCGLKSGSKAVQPLDVGFATSLEQMLDHVLPRLAESIRSGKFPVVTDDPGESFNADYCAIARTGPFRAVAEILEKRLPDTVQAARATASN
jgi:ATP-dependent helicase/nuclease subunit B